jgi:ferredoxin-NADP reductase
MKVTLIQRRPETPDAATLRFDLGGQPFTYKPGQAIDIDPHQFPQIASRLRENEPNRGFSLCSYESEFIEITVKMEPKGLVSPILVRELKIGDSMEIMGPYGLYTIPDKLDPAVECFLHITAGSGVAPNRGIWRYAMAKGLPVTHAIFCQNRTTNDIIYCAELASLDPQKAKVVHVLSHPDRNYITLDLLRRELPVDPSKCLAFVCGPNRPSPTRPGFVDSFIGNKRKNELGILGRLGIPFERIKSELW